MSKLSITLSLAFGLGAFVLLQSCHSDHKTVIEDPKGENKSFTQGFESLAAAQTQGWIFKYQSNDPNYTYPWTVETEATAPEGTHALFSWNDFFSNSNAHDADSSISNWAISPVVWFQNGDSISFYTYSTGQTEPVSAYDIVADRLQLRMTYLDSTSNTGTTSDAVGSFTLPLLDINATQSNAPEAYPSTWKKFTAVISGLNHPYQGRFAIRYFVQDFYDNGWGVYVDKVTYTSTIHN